ncbi:CG15535 [Drosophila busckii]|uniref:CG15535 n=2 Tax=Drosophila busckii TaxID=30019 RepID=A0A0M4F6Z7_DROBS|nr:CG15535 [Drosophila busckii]
MIRQQKAAEAEAERQKIKSEKEERIKAYKKQRLEKTKVISKRTQRGQPLMKDRMQLLLKQIEEMKKR